MPELATPPQLEALLQHPSLWRGRDAAAPAGLSTGFAALDAALPGGGWPQRGLIEILVAGHGHGELSLCAPLVRRLSSAADARWCAFIAPPFEIFAPAWAAQGTRLDRLLVVRTAQPLWALEQSLLSGACAIGFTWQERASMTELRRLALATERGGSLGVLIRPVRVAVESTAAVLRVVLTRTATRLRLEVLKSRGAAPRRIELALA